MSFPKQIKDIIYQLLNEPTLDKLREFLSKQTGEHNSVDFKQQWIETDKLAKEMLAIANSGGGIIVFGVAENDDGSVHCEGLGQLKDKAVVSNEVKYYIPSTLKYEIYDFSYTTSEYKELEGNCYQLLVVEDVPQHIPFMAQKSSTHLNTNEIYVRRGTSCEKASQEELTALINRRISYIHPLNGEPLQLEEHLKQLKTLYMHISKENVYYRDGILSGLGTLLSSFASTVFKGEKVVEANPLYPTESYDEFIARMITQKKNKIERFLDLY